MLKSAAQMAFKDISEETIIYCTGFGNTRDVWTVSSTFLNTIKNRSLNKKLGLNKLNYFKNTNGKK